MAVAGLFCFVLLSPYIIFATTLLPGGMASNEIQQVKMRFGIIGNAEGLARAIDIAIQVAPTDLSVLITGESGVGKESFPQIIHQYSSRKHGQYIAVNCGAIPEGTIDSELFGHEKGAFTGAISERKGYFDEANGGTIFLDEVGELPLPTQARLLRVLESGEFIKVGSSKVEKTDVRIVAATNVNLPQAIADGKFREDLYYRLNTVPIKVPALRERGDDVLLLFKKFAMDFAQRYRMPGIRLDAEAQHMLKTYKWPGNVRQLKNITEQISIIETNRDIGKDILSKYLPKEEANVMFPILLNEKPEGKTFNSEREILYQVLWDMKRDIAELKETINGMLSNQRAGQGGTPLHDNAPNAYGIGERMLPQIPVQSPAETRHSDFIEEPEYLEPATLSLDELEKEGIRKALEKHHGRRKAAAKELNISERTLYRKIKEYGIQI